MLKLGIYLVIINMLTTLEEFWTILAHTVQKFYENLLIITVIEHHKKFNAKFFASQMGFKTQF